MNKNHRKSINKASIQMKEFSISTEELSKCFRTFSKEVKEAHERIRENMKSLMEPYNSINSRRKKIIP